MERVESPPPELTISVVTEPSDVLEWVNTFDVAFGGDPQGREHPWFSRSHCCTRAKTRQVVCFSVLLTVWRSEQLSLSSTTAWLASMASERFQRSEAAAMALP